MTTRRNGGSVKMMDVALHAGVSQSTVSRVLNNQPGISSRTRDVVLGALRQLGYKAELFSRMGGELHHRELMLAIVPLPEQKNPLALHFYTTLAAGVRDGLGDNNLHFQMQILDPEADTLPGLEEGRPDGVILAAYPSERLRAGIRNAGIPYVIASCNLATTTEDLITVNNFEACREACRRLLEHGLTRIGFLLNPVNQGYYDGFSAELRRHGLSVRPRDFRLVPDTDLVTCMKEIHHWVREGDLPEVLVVSSSNDAAMIRSMQQLNNIEVLNKVRLLAFSDYPEQMDSSLFSLKINTREIGRRAVRRLLEKLDDPGDGPCQIVVPMLWHEAENLPHS